jgi:hypothetical protein
MRGGTEVIFIGGPYDGHVQTFVVPADRLFRKMAVPVNRNVFRALAGQPRGPEAPASSVAIYELVDQSGRWTYEFAEARRAKELNLESWRV